MVIKREGLYLNEKLCFICEVMKNFTFEHTCGEEERSLGGKTSEMHWTADSVCFNLIKIYDKDFALEESMNTNLKWKQLSISVLFSLLSVKQVMIFSDAFTPLPYKRQNGHSLPRFRYDLVIIKRCALEFMFFSPKKNMSSLTIYLQFLSHSMWPDDTNLSQPGHSQNHGR